MSDATLPIRVTVLDTWNEVPLVLPSATPVTEVKRAALAASRVRRPPAEYVLKYLGAELFEGNATLADAGVLPHAALIVLPRRRSPVR